MKLKLSILCAVVALMSFGVKSYAKVPLADPFIIYEDGLYYAYGTYAGDGIAYFTSPDLKIWKYCGLALRRKDTSVKKWFWAPEVYKTRNGEYIMYFSGNEHLYVAKSKSLRGPFKQVGTKPMLAEKSIDSSIFFKGKKAYIVFVRMNDGNNIWVAPLSEDLCRLDSAKMTHCFSVSQPWEKDMGRVVEGPNVIRKGRKLYMIYSANDYHSQNYGLGLAVAKKPEGPWVKRSDNPFLQKPDTLVGVGHNSHFIDKDGKRRIVFHAHENRAKVHPRYMYIGTLNFDHKDKDRLVVSDIIEAEEDK